MARILKITIEAQVSDDEATNFLARLGEGAVVGATVSDPVTPAAVTADTPAPAAVTPAAPAADKPKGRGRPKKTDAAPAAPAMPTMPPAAPAAPVMPGMPGMPAAAPEPVSFQAMLDAYQAAAAAGKVTNEMMLAKYAEFGITDPNVLATDEGKRTLIYNFVKSL